MSTSHRNRTLPAAILIGGMLAGGGCPNLAGSVSAPQKAHFSIGFTRNATVQVLDTSAVAGPVNPTADTTVDILVYSVGMLSASDLTITLHLVAGETVVQEYDVRLESTAFEALPPSIPQISESADGSRLDTRYVAQLVLSCPTCDPNALFPDSYSWRTTVERADGATFRGTIDFNYSLYLGPIMTP